MHRRFLLLALIAASLSAALSRTSLADGHTDTVRSVAFSPDGKTLASGAQDMTVRLWDLETGKHLRTITEKECIGGVAFSSDGKSLYIGTSPFARTGEVSVWDVSSLEKKQTITQGNNGVQTIALPGDGKIMAVLFGGGEVQLASPTAKTKPRSVYVFDGHKSYVDCLAFAKNGKFFATGARDSKAVTWNVATGKKAATFAGAKDWIRCLAFSPDGKQLATGDQSGAVILWDAATGKQLNTLKGHSRPVLCMAYNPNGKTLYTGSENSSVNLWDVKTGEAKPAESAHSHYVSVLAVSTDGKLFATGSWDNRVAVYDAVTGKRLFRFPAK